MSSFEELQKKIRAKQAHAGIVGLGYVGLPLAVEFAQAGFTVTGIDIERQPRYCGDLFVQADALRPAACCSLPV